MSTAEAVVAGPQVWTIDSSHSVAEFTAKHMMITTVRGRFDTVVGVVQIDETDPSKSTVEVEIDAAGIDSRSEQRDTHLRSADFLDVEAYPKVTFKSSRVEGGYAEVGDTFKVIGDLTIRGTTREVTLDVTYEGSGRDPWGGERVSFSADTKIDRRDFNLTWNVALEAGGVLVSNEIKIHIEAQAVKAA